MPASTIIFLPFKGSFPQALSTFSTRIAEYLSIKLSSEYFPRIGASVKPPFSAMAIISSTSFPSSPPSGVKNLSPFLSKGMCEAVIMTEASQSYSGCFNRMNIEGVEDSPVYKTSQPLSIKAFAAALLMRSAEILLSFPIAILSGFLLYFALNHAANARQIISTAPSVSVMGVPASTATPRISVPLFSFLRFSISIIQ